MKRDAINVFSDWADQDKDYGMEKNHIDSVENMLSFSTLKDKQFSFIDAGCGNGWVVRKVFENPNCIKAIGVDGSINMIKKAKKINPTIAYYCADLMSWLPKEKVDIVHSMEVFYYLENPKKMIDKIYDNWLKANGRLIIGIDFYFENKSSHEWPEKCGIKNMKLYKEREWKKFFINSGFKSVKSWRFGAKKNWAGTLIITGQK